LIPERNYSGDNQIERGTRGKSGRRGQVPRSNGSAGAKFFAGSALSAAMLNLKKKDRKLAGKRGQEKRETGNSTPVAGFTGSQVAASGYAARVVFSSCLSFSCQPLPY